MLDKEFFRGLNTSPVNQTSEVFCDKVHKVCKQMRKMYGDRDTFLTHSWTKEADLIEMCHKEGISSRVPKKILFGNVEQSELF